MATHVVIIIDDSSIYEYTDDLCPRIATLRKKSTTFTNLHTHPVCTLSRTAYMYGSYGKKIGSIDEAIIHTWPLHPYPSIASVLTAAGYATCFIGKWHGGVDPLYTGGVPGGPNTHAFAQAPISRGFQEVRAMSAGNLGEGGGDYYNWTRLDSTAGGWTSTAKTTYMPGDMIVEAADWLSDTSGNANRFLHFALTLPHAPFHVPNSAYLNGYTGDTSTDRGKYLAMLRATDTIIGSLLDLLGANPNVFVWSDNGTPDSVPTPGYDPERMKRSSFQEGTRVLGVYRQKDVLPQVSNRLIHSIDIGATILKSAGVAIPTEWDGVPFGNRTAVLTERQDANEKDRSCRTNCYLYRELTSASLVVTEQLYYLPDDPDEQRNVLGKPKHAAALAWLRARMAAAAI